MTFEVSLSLSCASEIPHMSNSFFNSGSKLFTSNPVFGSQPTCPMCWKLLGVPISALVSFFFLGFPFFFSLLKGMLFICTLYLLVISGFLISTVAIGRLGPFGGSRFLSGFLGLLPSNSVTAFLNLLASSSLAKLRPS